MLLRAQAISTGSLGSVGQSQAKQTMDIPFFLDNTAPKATDFTLVEEDGRYLLEFLVQDNHYVNYIQLGDSTSQERLAAVGDGFGEITEPGALTQVSIDITNYGDLCAKKGLKPCPDYGIYHRLCGQYQHELCGDWSPVHDAGESEPGWRGQRSRLPTPSARTSFPPSSYLDQFQ